MSRVFRIEPAPSTTWLVGQEGVALRIAGLNGDSHGSTWPRTEGSYASVPGVRRETYDIPWVSGATIALPSRESSFAEALAPHGEYLPVDAPDKRYWLFNCTSVLDGALLSGTEGEWFDDGLRMFELRKAVFDPAAIAEHPAFRIREMRTVLFVNESITAEYSSAGLTGIVFEETWSS